MTDKKILLPMIVALFVLGAAARPAAASPADDVSDFSALDCGSYRVAGRFFLSPKGISFLTLYPDTQRVFRMPVRHVAPDDAIAWNGANVALEVKVTRREKRSALEFVGYDGLSSAKQTMSSAEAVTKLSDAKCAE